MKHRILYVGLFAVVCGQFLFVVVADRPAWGAAFVVIGMALTMVAWRHDRLAEPCIAPPARTHRDRWRASMLGGGVALALWLAFRVAVPTQGFGLFLPTAGSPLAFLSRPPGHVEQAVCWLLSMGLFVLGAMGRLQLFVKNPRHGFWTEGLSPLSKTARLFFRARPDRRLALRLLALTGLALTLRLVNVEDGVPVLYVDESAFAALARSIAEDGEEVTLFAPGHYSHPMAFSWAMSPFVKALGRTRTAARMLPALAGALTAPALYWFAAELFNRRVALVGACVLAVYPVHIHFSRMALNNVIDPLFSVLAFAALARGLRSGRAVWFAFAGVMLGVAQYFYAAARMLPLLMLLLIGALAIQQARAVRAAWRGLAWALGGFLIAVLPAGACLLANRLPLTSRVLQSFDTVTFLHLPFEHALNAKFIPALLAYVHTSDGFYFYGGETPLLLFLAGIFFLLGLVHLLVNWRTTPGFLLLSWLALPTMLSAFLIEVPGYARLVIATPIIAVAAALGLDRIVCALKAVRVRRAGVVTAALVAAVAVGNVTYYFGAHLPAFVEAFDETAWWIHAIGERAQTLPYKTNPVFLTGPKAASYTFWTYSFHNGATDVIWAYDAPALILSKLKDDPTPYALFFSEAYQDVVTPLIEAHPEGELGELPTPPDVGRVFVFYVPGDAELPNE